MQEQIGDYLECAFLSEPGLKSIQIVDLDAQSKQALLFQSFNGSLTDSIRVPLDSGRYECRVENEFGIQSKILVLGRNRKYFLILPL